MTEKAIYTRKLGAAVASQAKARSRAKYHVIATIEHKWAVVRNGELAPIKTFDRQQTAIDFAKMRATLQAGSVVVIHDELGGVAKRIAS